MSVEISSDILAVCEKCRWKFPATIKLCEKNVVGNFQRHFGCERKMSVEIRIQFFNSFFFPFTKHLARYMEISMYFLQNIRQGT